MRGKSIIIIMLAVVLTVNVLPHHVTAKTIKIKNVGTTKVMPLYSDWILETNIKPWKLRFTSSDEDVATVTEEGRIRTKMLGKTTIRVRQRGKKKTKTVQTIHLTVRRPKGYTISSNSGKYFRGICQVNLRAAKGYTVYYATTSKFPTTMSYSTTKASRFRINQKIKSGKTKKLVFSKTTLLKVYAVKNGRKVTGSFLNDNKTSNRNYGLYYYRYVPPCGTDLLQHHYPIMSPSPQPTAAVSESPQPTVLPSGQPYPTADVSQSPQPTVLPSG